MFSQMHWRDGAVVFVLVVLAGLAAHYYLHLDAVAVGLVVLLSVILVGAVAYASGVKNNEGDVIDNPDHTELMRRERRFRSVLVDALADPALFVTHEGRIECANVEARKRFRFNGESPILTSVIRRPEVIDAHDAARRTGVSQSCSFVQIDDLERHYVCKASPVDMQGGQGVLITMSDLSAVKRAERARATFLENASHELRTPLQSLSGYIETMRGPARDDLERWDRFLEIMHGQSDRMRRLINDLLSLSRIELIEHVKPDTDADLALIVREVVDALEPVAEDKGVVIDVSGATSNVVVRGVRDELAQVAQNLLDNAIKYSEKGQTVRVCFQGDLSRENAVKFASRSMEGAGRLTISSNTGVTKNSFAALRVIDEGPGIERKHLPRLSERFYRVDPGRGLRRGTGLGLAIVKHIMTRHRGDFYVESIVGQGTAFGVMMPTPPKT